MREAPAEASQIEVEPVIETVPPARQVIPGREVNAPQPGEAIVRLPAPPVPVQPPRPVNLGIVTVMEANRLDTRRGAITLDGTRAVDAGRVCPLADGRTPDCRILARTAVRRFVGQRRVECVLAPREDAGRDHRAPCAVGDTDLALWVVAQGWAYADEDASGALRAAETLARAEERGLWAILGPQ